MRTGREIIAQRSDYHLLRGLVRDGWGFNGVIMADNAMPGSVLRDGIRLSAKVRVVLTVVGILPHLP